MNNPLRLQINKRHKMSQTTIIILEFLIIFSTVLQPIKASGPTATAGKRVLDAGVSATRHLPSYAVLREIHKRSSQPMNLNGKLILLTEK